MQWMSVVRKHRVSTKNWNEAEKSNPGLFIHYNLQGLLYNLKLHLSNMNISAHKGKQDMITAKTQQVFTVTTKYGFCVLFFLFFHWDLCTQLCFIMKCWMLQGPAWNSKSNLIRIWPQTLLLNVRRYHRDRENKGVIAVEMGPDEVCSFLLFALFHLRSCYGVCKDNKESLWRIRKCWMLQGVWQWSESLL